MKPSSFNVLYSPLATFVVALGLAALYIYLTGHALSIFAFQLMRISGGAFSGTAWGGWYTSLTPGETAWLEHRLHIVYVIFAVALLRIVLVAIRNRIDRV